MKKNKEKMGMKTDCQSKVPPNDCQSNSKCKTQQGNGCPSNDAKNGTIENCSQPRRRPQAAREL